jgi:hexosaminidase
MSKRELRLAMLILACFSVSFAADSGGDIGLVPKPVELVAQSGQMHMGNSVRVSYQPSSRGIKRIAGELGEAIKAVADVKVRIGTGSQPKKGVYLTLDNTVSQSEGYRLEISPDQVKLAARQEAGLFYGVQTLKQLLFHANPGSKKATAVLPCLKIVDYPRFTWRGMHLDVSRHFFPKEFIKQYIDVLAMYKMNVFHWHLTDDHGWRIEIKHYPRLTEFGAWREPNKNADQWLYGKDRSMDLKKRTYGGFYTQQDIREVIEYARQRYVTVLPEIEMPAHSMAALDSYPELSCTGKPFVPPEVVNDKNEFTDPFCAGNDKTFEFLENVLSEVIDLFPSPYIHCGGDEARKSSWEACPKCQARMRAEGLKDASELQSYFMKRIEKFVVSKQKKMIGWDEIIEGGLAPEATVMNWRSEKGGVEAARLGHDVVMADWGYVYFGTGRYMRPTKTGESGLMAKLRQVYQYNPLPSVLTPDQAGHILGVQGCIWTETVDTTNKAMETLVPALCPLSELDWIGPTPTNWPDFDRRLKKHYAFLDSRHIEYFGAQNPAPGQK